MRDPVVSLGKSNNPPGLRPFRYFLDDRSRPDEFRLGACSPFLECYALRFKAEFAYNGIMNVPSSDLASGVVGEQVFDGFSAEGAPERDVNIIWCSQKADDLQIGGKLFSRFWHWVGPPGINRIDVKGP